MTYNEAMDNTNFASLLIEGRIDNHLNRLKREFTSILNANKMLKEENAQLRGEHYKDEELSKLKCELVTVKANNEFLLTDEEAKRRYEFMEHLKTCERYKKLGTYSYEVTPTPIGKAVDLKCCCGHETELIKL